MRLSVPLLEGATEQDRSAMQAAIVAAEQARGHTGDNPWVGAVITNTIGEILSEGHTQGPGEDHAEIVAMRALRERGTSFSECILYSTLEPCSFHGRTPSCARVIGAAGFQRVVVGIRDPNPRVNGLGLSILQQAGVFVMEGVAAHEITAQLAPWIFEYHPHQPLRRASMLLIEQGMSRAQVIQDLSDHYSLPKAQIEIFLGQLGDHP